MNTVDFLIIGGGVLGLTMALELKKRNSDASVVILEKEADIALHASGRNSGVLHAGFYYTADSLKAKFTRDGNIAMRQYCTENKLRMNACGKLVVCRDDEEWEGLKELHRRGQVNGVELEWIDEKQAKEIEPRILTNKNALWSPNTVSVDPVEVTACMAKDAEALGVEIRRNTPYIKRQATSNIIETPDGAIEAGYIINAAGLYADRIAADFGFSKDYRILPFKGLYLYADAKSYRPKVHIYPVPDLKYPFLGVHFTLTVDGRAKIGPTAIPSFWRENYKGLEKFKLNEAAEIISREMKMWIGNNFGFRHLAWQEMKKYRKSFMVKGADQMLSGANEMNFKEWGKPGIRAQLVNIKSNKLEMDFVYEGDDKSFHLLNAVSPAFTCSLSFASFLVDEIDKKLTS